jgi:hypothetical protein
MKHDARFDILTAAMLTLPVCRVVWLASDAFLRSVDVSKADNQHKNPELVNLSYLRRKTGQEEINGT